MTTHKLKTIQPFFNNIVEGKKTFEIRYNDRNFEKGDYLDLYEFCNDGETGSVVKCAVTYIGVFWVFALPTYIAKRCS